MIGCFKFFNEIFFFVSSDDDVFVDVIVVVVVDDVDIPSRQIKFLTAFSPKIKLLRNHVFIIFWLLLFRACGMLFNNQQKQSTTKFLSIRNKKKKKTKPRMIFFSLLSPINFYANLNFFTLFVGVAASLWLLLLFFYLFYYHYYFFLHAIDHLI